MIYTGGMVSGKMQAEIKQILVRRERDTLSGEESWMTDGGMKLDPFSTPQRVVVWNVGGHEIPEENVRGVRLPEGARRVVRVIVVR